MDHFKKITELIDKNNNIIILGEAGTGKTHLLKQIHDYYPERTVLCATTGIAANNLDAAGSTLHSYLGIPIDPDLTVDELIQHVTKKSELFNNWTRQELILIIDECSMLPAKLLDIIDEAGQEIRSNERPFGGIQIVFGGDFYQLPPIGGEYMFKSRVFNKIFFKDNIIVLRKNYRHNEEMAKIMRELRYGTISDEVDALLREKCNIANEDPKLAEIIPTKLYAVNWDVDKENNDMLNKLPGEMKTFNCIDKGNRNYARSILIPETLKLKVGAQVMCLKNLKDQKVYNGTRGVVVGFAPTEGARSNKILYPVVKFGNDRTMLMTPITHEIMKSKNCVFKRTQIPLKLCWAITIHKSQGLQFNSLDIDLADSDRNAGQAYVAMTRAMYMERLRLKNYRRECFKVNKDVVAFYEALDRFLGFN